MQIPGLRAFAWLGAVAALLLVASVASAPLIGGASAQRAEPPKNVPQKKAQRRQGGSIPEAAGQRALLLDELYANLATATDEEVAQRISEAIEHVWLVSGSDTVSLLMERALKAANGKKPELALKLLGAVVELAPDYAEGWNRRAYVYYTQNNFELALADLRRVLALDPSHYKALDGLAQILREIGQKKAALAVYRRLLEVNPHMSGAKSAADELARELEGQEI